MYKITYEHRFYKSVTDKNLSWDISQKSTEAEFMQQGETL